RARSRPPPLPCSAETTPHSAHSVNPYEALSTLQPVTTRPSSVSAAAPTGNPEYGAWARGIISRAAAWSEAQSMGSAAIRSAPSVGRSLGQDLFADRGPAGRQLGHHLQPDGNAALIHREIGVMQVRTGGDSSRPTADSCQRTGRLLRLLGEVLGSEGLFGSGPRR